MKHYQNYAFIVQKNITGVSPFNFFKKVERFSEYGAIFEKKKGGIEDYSFLLLFISIFVGVVIYSCGDVQKE